jgi:hypothetical protein
LIGKLRKAQLTLRETFRYFDENKDHVICIRDFEMLLRHYGYKDFTAHDTWKMFSFFSGGP